MRWFRHADGRYPFLWESEEQPAARWHGPGEGPAQYFADTPVGAWAEFLRHEAITDADDLRDVRRTLWAIEVPEIDFDHAAIPSLPSNTLTGGLDSYPACRAEAERLRSAGASALQAPSAALVAAGATPERTDRGLRRGPPADGRTLVLFGRRPFLDGWRVADGAVLHAELLDLTRSL